MSMIGHFRLVPESSLPPLQDYDDEQMADFLFPEDFDSDPTVDIDKSWHAIHFLLCASPDPGTSEESKAILGGSEVGPDLGYGPLRVLPPNDVARVADVLEGIDRAALLERFDPARLTAADVYPQMWDEDDPTLESYIGDNYETVRNLYLQGREAGQAMLLWLA
jgi:hypothetical protein